MAESGGARRRGPGATGVVVIVALVAIAGAWLVTTFGSSIASAAQSAQERVGRVFMSDEEEIEQAVRDYVEAYNYEGSDGAQWREQVEGMVVPGEYYASPVGKQFKYDTQAITELSNEGYSTRTELEIEQWQLDEKTGERASGTFTWRASYDVINDDEEPDQDQGKTKLRLSYTNEGWKVISGDEASN